MRGGGSTNPVAQLTRLSPTDVAHRPMVYAEWIHEHIIYEWYVSKHKKIVKHLPSSTLARHCTNVGLYKCVMFAGLAEY